MPHKWYNFERREKGLSGLLLPGVKASKKLDEVYRKQNYILENGFMLLNPDRILLQRDK